MKYFYGILIVIVLFVLPIGSYLYLQAGYKYRLGALDELKAKEPLSDCLIGSLPETIASKVVVIGIISEENDTVITSNLKQIAEQYEIREEFAVAAATKGDSLLLTPIEWPGIRISLDCPSIVDSVTYVLMDSKGLIRGVYGGHAESVKKLVEHTAILLPLPKRKTITLKRELLKDSI